MKLLTMAYPMIQKSYKPKFGSLIQQLETAQQFKKMEYLKTLIEAKELLASHTYDPGWNKNNLIWQNLWSRDNRKIKKESRRKPKKPMEQLRFLAY